jgi:hypothetical protein
VLETYFATLVIRLVVIQAVYTGCCISMRNYFLLEHSQLKFDVLRFQIDAFTIFAVPATGPHGFHAIGR